MDESRQLLYFSGIDHNARMPPPAMKLVPFREVRHDEPDDSLHYESVAVRGQELDWTIPAHRHEGLHQFQFLAQGKVEGEIDGERFEAIAPLLLMLAPGSVHGFTYSPDAVGHQVTLPSATLKQLLYGSELTESALGSSFIVDGEEAIAAAAESGAMFESLAREFQANHPGRAHALLSYATLLAVRFIRSRGEQAAREKSKGLRDTLVQRYKALVETGYREHRPLSHYAHTLGVTADHLSRTARQVTGQSALEVLHERLMLEARRLLAYTPMSVAKVAQELGYTDAAYFSKFFARQVGQTPSVYRAAVANGVRGAASKESSP